MKILLVEDDELLAKGVLEMLTLAEYEVTHVTNGECAVKTALKGDFSLIILDILLPVFSGFEVCQRLREQQLTTPIIMLTSRDDEEDLIRALKLGADDYITKPFSGKELLARMAALLRRNKTFAATHADKDILLHKSLTLNLRRKEVIIKGQVLDLTRREFDLLHFMLKNKGRPITRDELLDSVWGKDSAHSYNVIDVYIGYIRKKIENAGCKEQFIRTKRGIGYIFD